MLWLVLYSILCSCWYPEIETNTIDWVQLSRLFLKTEIEPSFRKAVLIKKNRTTNHVQKHNFISMLSPQTYKSNLNYAAQKASLNKHRINNMATSSDTCIMVSAIGINC
jgi:hypothetical protein